MNGLSRVEIMSKAKIKYLSTAGVTRVILKARVKCVSWLGLGIGLELGIQLSSEQC